MRACRFLLRNTRFEGGWNGPSHFTRDDETEQQDRIRFRHYDCGGSTPRVNEFKQNR